MRIIGEEAFLGISGMENIHVPRRLYQLGANAFGSNEGDLLTIYGYEDSLAHEYAKENGNAFISLGKKIDSCCWSETLNYAGNIYSYGSDLDLSAMDALAILKHVVGLKSDVEEKCADADQNGKVDAEDALYVLKCAVGLEEPIVLEPDAYETI